MKNIILASVIVLLGAGCLPAEVEDDSKFSSNEKCFNYLGEAEKYLEEWHTGTIVSPYLDQIFYSPVNESCLIAFRTYTDFSSELWDLDLIRVTDWYIEDFFTKEILFENNVAIKKNDPDEWVQAKTAEAERAFLNEINQYK